MLTWIAAVEAVVAAIVVATKVAVVTVVSTPGVSSGTALVLINTP